MKFPAAPGMLLAEVVDRTPDTSRVTLILKLFGARFFVGEAPPPLSFRYDPLPFVFTPSHRLEFDIESDVSWERRGGDGRMIGTILPAIASSKGAG